MSSSGSPTLCVARISASMSAVGIAHRQPNHEPVELRLGQGIGALVLDGVLRRDDDERRAEAPCVSASIVTCRSSMHSSRADCVFGEARLISSPEHDVGEHRAGAELEVAALLVEHVHAGDVGGQHVGRELDAAERAVDRAGHRLGEHRLADARARPRSAGGLRRPAQPGPGGSGRACRGRSARCCARARRSGRRRPAGSRASSRSSTTKSSVVRPSIGRSLGRLRHIVPPLHALGR